MTDSLYKIAVMVNYRGDTYTSNFDKYSKKEELELESLIIKITEGKSSYFSIMCNNRKVYFTSKVLEESVITIIKEVK